MISKLLLLLVRVYQYCLSPYFGLQCRFYPSCSNYASMAIQQHGVINGAALTLWRLLRCQPYAKGGVDLVPASSSEKTNKGDL